MHSRRLLQQRNVIRAPLFQFTRFAVQDLRLFVPVFQSPGKDRIVFFSVRHADILTGIQTPALVFDFLSRGDFAASGYIDVFQTSPEDGTSLFRSKEKRRPRFIRKPAFYLFEIPMGGTIEKKLDFSLSWHVRRKFSWGHYWGQI
jgi:hypothetical protein